MIKYKKIMVEQKEWEEMQCDKCKKVYAPTDFLEVQEFHHVSFCGGYGSVFGDESSVYCDLCQHCLKELIGSFCRIDG